MTHGAAKTKYTSGHPVGLAVAIAVIMITLIFSCPAFAKAPQQKTFASPTEAFTALVKAMKGQDTNELAKIFGPGGKMLVFSGDAVADKAVRDNFVKAYEEKSRIETIDDKKSILHIGNNDWPLPIPLIKTGNAWRFDTKAGKEEILQRRIGRNELSAIKACQAYVDAQREYAAGDYDGDGLFEYAQKFVSTPGKKDGLYWETKDGEPQSPLGALIAVAAREGYLAKKDKNKAVPFHGYYYKILKEQGKDAPGGAYSYLANGKMIGGFALAAYPAQYGNSGVMTFIVNKDGLVYQRDLGRNTSKTAQAMKTYNPDQTWKKAE